MCATNIFIWRILICCDFPNGKKNTIKIKQVAGKCLLNAFFLFLECEKSVR